jgi:Leucine-rich repeat (LRR) protein
MFLALRATFWNSLFFIIVFVIYFGGIHFSLFGKTDLAITVLGCVILALVIGGLITLKNYRIYGISRMRLLNGRTKRVLTINYVQNITLPLSQEEVCDQIVKLAHMITGEEVSLYKLSPELVAVLNTSKEHLTVFYFTTKGPSETNIEVSTRGARSYYFLYDFQISRRIVNFWIEILEMKSAGAVLESKNLKEKFTNSEKTSLNLIFTSLPWLLVFAVWFLNIGDDVIKIKGVIPQNFIFQIRAQINKPYGKLTDDDYSSITQLHRTGMRFYNLNGLDRCNNLNMLILDNCKIKDIKPLESCTKLHTLSLNSNRISDISPLVNLKNLEILHITNNQITDIKPLSKLPNLNRLDISYNKITDFSPLENMHQLKMIGLSGYNFGNFDLIANFSDLEGLMYAENGISDLTPVSKFRNLDYLDLSSNLISDIKPLKNMDDLESLILNKNQIPDIAFITELKKLRNVDLSKNKITDLTPLVKSKDLNPDLAIILKGNLLSWHSMTTDLQTLKDRGIKVKY